jgi:hypothetical protein
VWCIGLLSGDNNPLHDEQNLDDFSCGWKVQFDSIYPVYVPTDRRENLTESKHGSTLDVDDFVAAMPVKEMHEVHLDIFGGEECVHNYFWMIRWLRTSMEISEVRHALTAQNCPVAHLVL